MLLYEMLTGELPYVIPATLSTRSTRS